MDSRKLLLLFILSGYLVRPVASSNVPYLEEWGIYELDIESEVFRPIFTSPEEILTVRLDSSGERMVLCMKTGGSGYEHSEIYTMDIDGGSLTRLTENDIWDLYPSWSPEGDEIAYLSFGDTLDLWMMNSDGGNQRLFYDSGGHDADIHWVDDLIAFTRDSQIWVINSDGTNPRRITDPPRAGEWGDAVLPFGDYDPRISPDGSMVIFERLVDDSSQHGNYDLFIVSTDGSSETRLTESGWTQGLASWSNEGQKLVYTVSAIGSEGRYDLYSMNPDGSDVIDLTSSLLPAEFLANAAIFSGDDSKIYFIGQWWGWERKTPTLDIQASPSNAGLGEEISLSGSLSPEVYDIQYTVKVLKPDGAEELSSVESPSGSFSYIVEANMIGDWTVTVEWVGNAGFEAVSSEESFNVVEKQETRRIPGVPLNSVIIGLASFAFGMRRKRL